MMSNQLTIHDVGPIQDLAINVQPEGGVTVLRGRNGSGKSTALDAAESLVRGEGKLQTRDKATGSGRVDGFGATLILGRKVTRAGEVEIASLEGRLNIADLVQPPLKEPGAADRKRIKALVSLTGVEPSAELFKPILGDDLMHYVSAATWANKDLLDVAAKAKRDLEAKAREKENEASLREGQAKACAESVNDVDITLPDDEASLRQAHIEASGKMSALQERQQAAEASAAKLARAREGLEKIRSTYTGPTVEQAKAKVTEVIQLEVDQAELVRKFEAQLESAKQVHQRIKDELVSAKNARSAAEEHAQTVAGYESILDQTATKPPTDEEVQAANDAVNAAASAVEQGAIVRRAKIEDANAKRHRADANEAAAIAERLRQAASQIDDVLSNAVASEQLIVRDGRLYCTSHPRGETLFQELSEGERWTLAFDIAAPVVGENGILVLPQAAWEALDPDNRAHIAELATKHRINVITAEATDGELRAEAFED